MTRMVKVKSTYVPRSSNFSSTAGALKLRTNSAYSDTSRFKRSPPLQATKKFAINTDSQEMQSYVNCSANEKIFKNKEK